MSSPKSVPFYSWPQHIAQSFLPHILRNYLPQSNPLYNRILAPQNTPERCCLFAASFPPPPSDQAQPLARPPSDFTILFSDRSRHHESQIWVFNSLIIVSNPTTSQSRTLHTHIDSCISFIRETPIPDAPGWPFSPVLRFGCIHERIADVLKTIAMPHDAVPHVTSWQTYAIDLSSIPNSPSTLSSLPSSFSFAAVPEAQLDIVVATSSIPRQSATLLSQPNVGILDGEGSLVAWGYIGLDGSFATLYVVPPQRGSGLATLVAKELMQRLKDGVFSVSVPDVEGAKSFDGGSGWVQSCVAPQNQGSRGVMRRLGGVNNWASYYLWVDCDRLPR